MQYLHELHLPGLPSLITSSSFQLYPVGKALRP